jgi:hypothetical protein
VAKLAQVTFSSSLEGTHYGPSAGRVSWNGWYWNKNVTGSAAGSSAAVGAGTSVGADCDQTGKAKRSSPNGELFNNGLNYQMGAVGELRTAYSFTGPPTENKQGDFYLVTSETPDYVHIRWDDGTSEDWDIATASVLIQRLTVRSSDLGYIEGVAAGSNSPFSVRVHPVSTLSHPVQSGFSQCTNATWAINEDHYLDPSNCSCNPSRSYKNQWRWRISGTDRRDSWHLWCHCLSEGADSVKGIWYYGGTHQYPLLQAIDDGGKFRGYVGVNAEPNRVSVITNLLDF